MLYCLATYDGLDSLLAHIIVKPTNLLLKSDKKKFGYCMAPLLLIKVK